MKSTLSSIFTDSLCYLCYLLMWKKIPEPLWDKRGGEEIASHKLDVAKSPIKGLWVIDITVFNSALLNKWIWRFGLEDIQGFMENGHHRHVWAYQRGWRKLSNTWTIWGRALWRSFIKMWVTFQRHV